ncbi:NUDIX hydrolase [Candidatus Thiomargarita nelsonii]|uniref:NUDIX hydrolase n=1 Tax=Candidatus Thiomargarita nelsonii TaxID=1003181 RepID=A0A4E0QP39_9GAMM|nr:NUDIX hydrolase [Candidatus Thiomargarita nelsonii]
MARTSIPTWYFVLVVVRSEDRYLMVQERKHGQLWYLPAGRVEPGETFVKAALRETLEETGIPVVLEGIVRVEHLPNISGARVRVIFTAKPQDNTPPKSTPDKESLKAAWVTLKEMESLPLRGIEVQEIFHYVANGAPIYPLNLISFEGAPFL